MDVLTALVLTAFLASAAAAGWTLACACAAGMGRTREPAPAPATPPTTPPTPRRAMSVWREVEQPGGERAVACAAFFSA